MVGTHRHTPLHRYSVTCAEADARQLQRKRTQTGVVLYSPAGQSSKLITTTAATGMAQRRLQCLLPAEWRELTERFECQVAGYGSNVA